VSVAIVQRNARSTISCCPTPCAFDEHRDGAYVGRRDIRLIPVNLSGAGR
jgi:hypothetical protein